VDNVPCTRAMPDPSLLKNEGDANDLHYHSVIKLKLLLG